MRILTMLFTTIVAALFGCGADDHAPQARSLLGGSLHAPSLPPDVEATFTAKLDEAHRRWKASPDDEDAIIWYGRRLAYLGRYTDAITVYTEGLQRHPDSHRLRRHRGHRYLTTRRIAHAIDDLSAAARLIENRTDRVEPDGLPNALNMPRSTEHTNIWYHLGLAQYVTGRFDLAAEAFERCIQRSTNDDMHVAAAYWRFLALARRAGVDEAAKTLDFVTDDLEIIENHSYYALVRLYAGQLSAGDLTASDDAVQDATMAYGLGVWDLLHDRRNAAYQRFDALMSSPSWAAFGVLAAEAELARWF